MESGPSNLKKKRSSSTVGSYEAKRSKLFKIDGSDFFSKPAELVVFQIGEDGLEQEFKVHKGHICHYSPVLKAAFNNPSFVEGQTQTYRLENVRPSCFKLFVQWIYAEDFNVLSKQDLISKPRPDEAAIEDIKEVFIEQDKDLSQLWILADKFLIPKLQNEVIRALCPTPGAKSRCTTNWFVDAWANTASDSLLRDFMVSLCAYHAAHHAYTDNPEHFPHEMLILVTSLLSSQSKTRLSAKSPLTCEAYFIYEPARKDGNDSNAAEIFDEVAEWTD